MIHANRKKARLQAVVLEHATECDACPATMRPGDLAVALEIPRSPSQARTFCRDCVSPSELSRTNRRTSAVSFRMPVEARRRVRVAAGLDDQPVPDWCIATLDQAARARIEQGFDESDEGSSDEGDRETEAGRPDRDRPEE